MSKTYEASLTADGATFAIVVSRFNSLVTERLLAAAEGTLRRHGAGDDAIRVAWVPGSFEIPVVANRLAKSGQFSAVVCLGAVIQGETTHHDYINHQVAAGLMQTSRETGVPVTFGILTCQSMDQALDRAGGKAGNKGTEAAMAALETAKLLECLAADGI